MADFYAVYGASSGGGGGGGGESFPESETITGTISTNGPVIGITDVSKYRNLMFSISGMNGDPSVSISFGNAADGSDAQVVSVLSTNGTAVQTLLNQNGMYFTPILGKYMTAVVVDNGSADTVTVTALATAADSGYPMRWLELLSSINGHVDNISAANWGSGIGDPSTVGRRVAAMVGFDNGGTPTAVSVANAMPVSITEDGAGLALETTLLAVSGQLPASLGSQPSADSLSVTLASDQASVPVSGTVIANAGTGTFTTDQVSTQVAVFQGGAIAFGSLTTSYATVMTAGGVLRNVMMRNNTNAVVEVSLDAGSTTSYILDPGDAVSVDLKTLGLNIANGTTLQARYSGSAPTQGSIRINGVSA